MKNKLAGPINRSAISRPVLATLVFFLLSVIVTGQPLGRYFLLAKNQDQKKKKALGTGSEAVEEKRGGGWMRGRVEGEGTMTDGQEGKKRG